MQDMLSIAGLTANFMGAIVLLAANVRIIERIVGRVDPVHFAYSRGLRWIESEARGEKNPDENRAYPFDDTVDSSWRVWPLLRFIDRHVEQELPNKCKIDIRGGHFKIDDEQLTLQDDRQIVKMPSPVNKEGHSLNTGGKASLSAIHGLIFEARRKRIYLWGTLGLVLGFGLQLIGSLAVFF
jgi:hypothetical protein